MTLEPISKLPEEDDEASKLNKTQKVLGVKFPSNEDATLPLYPSEEALDQPASLVSAFSAPSRPDLSSTSFGHSKGRVDKAFLLVQPTAVPQLVGDKTFRNVSLRHHV